MLCIHAIFCFFRNMINNIKNEKSKNEINLHKTNIILIIKMFQKALKIKQNKTHLATTEKVKIR